MPLLPYFKVAEPPRVSDGSAMAQSQNPTIFSSHPFDDLHRTIKERLLAWEEPASISLGVVSKYNNVQVDEWGEVFMVVGPVAIGAEALLVTSKVICRVGILPRYHHLDSLERLGHPNTSNLQAAFWGRAQF